VTSFAFEKRCARHLRATYGWLVRSLERGRGGSSALYAPIVGWWTPYPETTGYLIPTLIASGPRAGDANALERARALGTWLLGLQQPAGYWHGGAHPPKRPVPSVFNTAQVLDGMCALYRADGESRWLEAARRGAAWLARNANARGAFGAGNYRAGFNPSYYAQVAWPMLEVWTLTNEPQLRDAAERVLGAVLAKRHENGAFDDWGFEPGRPAFTHTIAYLLRGLIECARLLERPALFEAALPALERLRGAAETNRGRLPGAYDTDWRAAGRFVCLTGNAQLAL
jgi:hypothetical protein